MKPVPRLPPDPDGERFLDETLEVWQPRTARRLTREDAREIHRNVSGALRVLARWRAEELAQKRAGERAPSLGGADVSS